MCVVVCRDGGEDCSFEETAPEHTHTHTHTLYRRKRTQVPHTLYGIDKPTPYNIDIIPYNIDTTP